jgi:protein-disulfide isomerase
MLALTGIGALFSLFYFLVMLISIHSFCLFCLGIDAVNLLSFGAVLALRPEKTSAYPLDFSKWKTMGWITIACVLISVYGLSKTDSSIFPPDVSASEEVNEALARPVLSVEAGPEHPSMGPADAPITIVEFSDFQCPFCRIAASTLNTVVDHYQGKVRVVYRAYPLDISCNNKMKAPLHQFSCEATKVAFCSQKQGKFEAVYKTLFENQEEMAAGKPAEWAKEAGVDPAMLAQCVDTPEIGARIQKDIEDGNQLQVDSTPTLFVNGHTVKGSFPLSTWFMLLDRMLAQLGK